LAARAPLVNYSTASTFNFQKKKKGEFGRPGKTTVVGSTEMALVRDDLISERTKNRPKTSLHVASSPVETRHNHTRMHLFIYYYRCALDYTAIEREREPFDYERNMTDNKHKHAPVV